MIQKIVVRVYGILINEQGQVLVSDEFVRGSYFTKFPGGGLETGEGTRDCLQREFMEEMNLRVEVLDHLYTTDFYQQSAFNQHHQILSIYYYVRPLEPITVPIKQTPFDFDIDLSTITETEVFRLIDPADFSPDTVSLPIDKIVAEMIANKLNPPA
jgi:8-oxo-dGTP diphosphatase